MKNVNNTENTNLHRTLQDASYAIYIHMHRLKISITCFVILQKTIEIYVSKQKFVCKTSFTKFQKKKFQFYNYC